MSSTVSTATWLRESLPEAFCALARASGLEPGHLRVTVGTLDSERLVGEFLTSAARAHGAEAVRSDIRGEALEAFIRSGTPALLRITAPDGPYLVLAGKCRSRVRLIGPDLTERHVRPEHLCDSLRATALVEHSPELAEALSRVGGSRPDRIRAALSEDALLGQCVTECWVLRHGLGLSLFRQLARAGLLQRFALALLASLVLSLLWVGSWWILGYSVLTGRRFEGGWFWAWALMLLTTVPARYVGQALHTALMLGLAGQFRLRLFEGALRLDIDELRTRGLGHLFARATECETAESAGLQGGSLALLAVVDLGVASWVLSSGASPALHLLVLFGFLLWAALAVREAHRERDRSSALNAKITNSLIEAMVGHRTRRIQNPAWPHRPGEELLLRRYADSVAATEERLRLLSAWVPRAFLATSVFALVPRFASGTVSAPALAISIGGIVLAESALGRLCLALTNLSQAAVAWRNASLLLEAANRSELAGNPSVAVDRTAQPLLRVEDLSFGYRDRRRSVLRGCSLRVAEGDKILITGGSATGKSTLVSVVAGLHRAEQGMVLLSGLDLAVVGEDRWRGRVVATPQCHANHLFSASLAFNLLMGRRWPPREQDLRDAEKVCHALGLGDLLSRMPVGVWQTVGDGGWQLSHGERSRVYLARSLLQGGDLLLFDESLSALDPDSLRRSLSTILEQRTVNLVAHP